MEKWLEKIRDGRERIVPRPGQRISEFLTEKYDTFQGMIEREKILKDKMNRESKNLIRKDKDMPKESL